MDTRYIASFKEIREQAIKEIQQEDFDENVQMLKKRIRTKRPWWHYVCPFIITIKWRFNNERD